MTQDIIAYNTRQMISTKGYKQKAIAEKAGINYKAFNAIMNGRKKIYSDTIIKIASALECDYNDLFQPQPTYPST